MDKKERKKYWYDKAIEVQRIIGDSAIRVSYENKLKVITEMLIAHHKALADSVKKAVNDPKLRNPNKKPIGRNWELDFWPYILIRLVSPTPKLCPGFRNEIPDDIPDHLKEFWRKKLPPDPRFWWPEWWPGGFVNRGAPVVIWHKDDIEMKQKLYPKHMFHLQRKPNKKDSLVMDYALLAVIHDGVLRDANSPNKPLYFATLNSLPTLMSNWVKSWLDDCWIGLRDWDENTETKEGDDRRLKVESALIQVKSDLGLYTQEAWNYKTQGNDEEDETEPPPENYIQKGNMWIICFKNKPVHFNSKLLGLPLIEYLIRNTSGDKKKSAFDLERAVQKIAADKISDLTEDLTEVGLNETKTGSTIDNYALAKANHDELKASIALLEQQRDKTENDDTREELDKQIKVLETELKKKTNTFGKPKPVAGNPHNKARLRVRSNVKRIRYILETEHKELFKHFKAHLITGTYCYYISDPTVNWEFI